MDDCPFCWANWRNLDIIETWTGGSTAIINPLNPVVEGHVLVIHREHDRDAAVGWGRASLLFGIAAGYVRQRNVHANIITSIGALATQTVYHTHLHVVPRTQGDGLVLPWTNQHASIGGR